MLCTRENSDVFNSLDEIYLVFASKKQIYSIYPCSENKGADQLRSYCEADLRLCFRIGKNPVSHDAAQKYTVINYLYFLAKLFPLVFVFI